MNSIVICVDSLLFLSARMTYRAGSYTGGPVLSVLQALSGDPGLTDRKDYHKTFTCDSAVPGVGFMVRVCLYLLQRGYLYRSHSASFWISFRGNHSILT